MLLVIMQMYGLYKLCASCTTFFLFGMFHWFTATYKDTGEDICCLRYSPLLLFWFVVRPKGLEPSRRKTPDPKSGASANFATGAHHCFCCLLHIVIPLGLEPKTRSLEGCCSNPTELRNHYAFNTVLFPFLRLQSYGYFLMLKKNGCFSFAKSFSNMFSKDVLLGKSTFIVYRMRVSDSRAYSAALGILYVLLPNV